MKLQVASYRERAQAHIKVKLRKKIRNKNLNFSTLNSLNIDELEKLLKLIRKD